MMECSFVVGNISEIYLEKTAEKASNVTGYLKETITNKKWVTCFCEKKKSILIHLGTLKYTIQ